MGLAPVPEVRRMVEAARRYVAGEAHFSALVGPAEECALWAKVHGADPAIRELAEKWLRLADRVWNEYGQHDPALPEVEFRRQVADDLGLVCAAEPGAAPDRAGGSAHIG